MPCRQAQAKNSCIVCAMIWDLWRAGMAGRAGAGAMINGQVSTFVYSQINLVQELEILSNQDIMLATFESKKKLWLLKSDIKFLLSVLMDL